MDGFLDELHQAFLSVDLGQGPLDFQIDTGFSGAFLIGEELFDLTDAIPSGEVEADLAADQRHTFASFKQVIHWLGDEALVPILVGPGKDCLIGTAMFNPHRLEIDFAVRTVRLTPHADWM